MNATGNAWAWGLLVQITLALRYEPGCAPSGASFKTMPHVAFEVEIFEQELQGQ